MINFDANEIHTEPCPCCGHVVFDKIDESDICPICYWQNDFLCILQPFNILGPNKVSLEIAQLNFISTGLSDIRYKNVEHRLMNKNLFRIEKGWRPINREVDIFLSEEDGAYPEDIRTIYYWRPNYWLNKQRE